LRLAVWYEQQGKLNRADMHRVAALEDRARASTNMQLAPEEERALNAGPNER
jgi:hypothetical protein